MLPLIVCACCGRPERLFKMFTAGPCCRSCVAKASAITALYTIDGVVFREQLKAGPATAVTVPARVKGVGK